MEDPSGVGQAEAETTSNACISLEALPLMLSVSEAAEVLRISRTSAYRLVQEHQATKGLTGLPHVRLGSRVLVRRVDLAHIVGVEPPS